METHREERRFSKYPTDELRALAKISHFHIACEMYAELARRCKEAHAAIALATQVQS